jgi:hypothetical protein
LYGPSSAVPGLISRECPFLLPDCSRTHLFLRADSSFSGAHAGPSRNHAPFAVDAPRNDIEGNPQLTSGPYYPQGRLFSGPYHSDFVSAYNITTARTGARGAELIYRSTSRSGCIDGNGPTSLLPPNLYTRCQPSSYHSVHPLHPASLSITHRPPRSLYNALPHQILVYSLQPNPRPSFYGLRCAHASPWAGCIARTDFSRKQVNIPCTFFSGRSGREGHVAFAYYHVISHGSDCASAI